MVELITPEYRALLRRQHAETRWGSDLDFRHVDELLPLLREVDARSVLDFGSGRESLRTHLGRVAPEMDVHCYDPGVPGRDLLPPSVDVAVCCDVLEHVEPKFLDDTLSLLFLLAERGVYLVIALRQAGRPMVDGSPAHLIVRDQEFWQRRIREASRHRRWTEEEYWHEDGYELRAWLRRYVT